MNPQQPLITRIIAGCFGITFGGIGLTVLGHLWFSPFGGFGSPPLFFRLMGSFIAIPFIAFGVGAVYSAITGMQLGPRGSQNSLQSGITQAVLRKINKQNSTKPTSPTQLACPSCGAPLCDEEISPSGDVKCAHCQSWYNVNSDGA